MVFPSHQYDVVELFVYRDLYKDDCKNQSHKDRL